MHRTKRHSGKWTHVGSGGGAVCLFHHHSVDDTVFLHFGHSGLNQKEIRVSGQFVDVFIQSAFHYTYVLFEVKLRLNH